MPNDNENIKSRLLSGDRINITTRIVFKTDIGTGQVKFELPDAGITSDAIVDGALVDDTNHLFDGEQWGNVTLTYRPPEDRKKGYIDMVGYRPFKPYRIDLGYYTEARKEFTLEEWIDALIVIMGYNPDKIKKPEAKLEYIARFLPFVEPRLNLIELGPKSTGKSHLYNNFSKCGWVHKRRKDL